MSLVLRLPRSESLVGAPMPKAIARDSCGCWHDCMKNREQARSHNIVMSLARAQEQPVRQKLHGRRVVVFGQMTDGECVHDGRYGRYERGRRCRPPWYLTSLDCLCRGGWVVPASFGSRTLRVLSGRIDAIRQRASAGRGCLNGSACRRGWYGALCAQT